MEKIEFEKDIFIYQTNIDSENFQNDILQESTSFLKMAPFSPQDNYTYIGSWSSFDFDTKFRVNNNIDKIIKVCASECLNLIKDDNTVFNKVNISVWVNVVKSSKPKQSDFKKDGSVTLHNHIDIQTNIDSFYPNYTFVYYTQMPDNLSNEDGTLVIGGKNKRYYYLPKVGDIIIMNGGLPHSPNHALKSTKDRIVIAGNVGVENVKLKHSLI
jgi:hypothetical protein